MTPIAIFTRRELAGDGRDWLPDVAISLIICLNTWIKLRLLSTQISHPPRIGTPRALHSRSSREEITLRGGQKAGGGRYVRIKRL